MQLITSCVDQSLAENTFAKFSVHIAFCSVYDKSLVFVLFAEWSCIIAISGNYLR